MQGEISEWIELEVIETWLASLFTLKWSYDRLEGSTEEVREKYVGGKENQNHGARRAGISLDDE